MLVQVVAGRATITTSPAAPACEAQSALVLIAKNGQFDGTAISVLLDSAVTS